MTDEQKIIDHQVPSLAELAAATHYRDAHGDVSRIAHRIRACPKCADPTWIETATGVRSTFTRLHVDAGHLR